MTDDPHDGLPTRTDPWWPLLLLLLLLAAGIAVAFWSVSWGGWTP